MKIQEKYYKKYGSNTVILPPPPEEAVNQELTEEGEENPWDLPSEDDLAQMPLHHPSLPSIEEISPENWGDKWIMYNPGNPNRADVQDRIRLDMEMREKGNEIGNYSTVPPRKLVDAANKLVALCDKFAHDAINPPSLEGMELVTLPPSSKIPSIEDPDLEFLDQLFELKRKNKDKKKNEEAALLKQIEHNPTMPIGASRLDELIRMSSKYYDLCHKL